MVDRDSLPYDPGGLQINVIIDMQLVKEAQLSGGNMRVFAVILRDKAAHSSTRKYTA